MTITAITVIGHDTSNKPCTMTANSTNSPTSLSKSTSMLSSPNHVVRNGIDPKDTAELGMDRDNVSISGASASDFSIESSSQSKSNVYEDTSVRETSSSQLEVVLSSRQHGNEPDIVPETNSKVKDDPDDGIFSSPPKKLPSSLLNFWTQKAQRQQQLHASSLCTSHSTSSESAIIFSQLPDNSFVATSASIIVDERAVVVGEEFASTSVDASLLKNSVGGLQQHFESVDTAEIGSSSPNRTTSMSSVSINNLSHHSHLSTKSLPNNSPAKMGIEHANFSATGIVANKGTGQFNKKLHLPLSTKQFENKKGDMLSETKDTINQFTSSSNSQQNIHVRAVSTQISKISPTNHVNSEKIQNKTGTQSDTISTTEDSGERSFSRSHVNETSSVDISNSTNSSGVGNGTRDTSYTNSRSRISNSLVDDKADTSNESNNTTSSRSVCVRTESSLDNTTTSQPNSLSASEKYPSRDVDFSRDANVEETTSDSTLTAATSTMLKPNANTSNKKESFSTFKNAPGNVSYPVYKSKYQNKAPGNSILVSKAGGNSRVASYFDSKIIEADSARKNSNISNVFAHAMPSAGAIRNFSPSGPVVSRKDYNNDSNTSSHSRSGVNGRLFLTHLAKSSETNSSDSFMNDSDQNDKARPVFVVPEESWIVKKALLMEQMRRQPKVSSMTNSLSQSQALSKLTVSVVSDQPEQSAARSNGGSLVGHEKQMQAKIVNDSANASEQSKHLELSETSSSLETARSQLIKEISESVDESFALKLLGENTQHFNNEAKLTKLSSDFHRERMNLSSTNGMKKKSGIEKSTIAPKLHQELDIQSNVSQKQDVVLTFSRDSVGAEFEISDSNDIETKFDEHFKDETKVSSLNNSKLASANELDVAETTAKDNGSPAKSGVATLEPSTSPRKRRLPGESSGSDITFPTSTMTSSSMLFRRAIERFSQSVGKKATVDTRSRSMGSSLKSVGMVGTIAPKAGVNQAKYELLEPGKTESNIADFERTTEGTSHVLSGLGGQYSSFTSLHVELDDEEVSSDSAHDQLKAAKSIGSEEDDWDEEDTEPTMVLGLQRGVTHCDIQKFNGRRSTQVDEKLLHAGEAKQESYIDHDSETSKVRGEGISLGIRERASDYEVKRDISVVLDDLDPINLTAIHPNELSYDHIVSVSQDDNGDADASFKVFLSEHQFQGIDGFRYYANTDTRANLDEDPSTPARSHQSSDVCSGNLRIGDVDEEEQTFFAELDEIDDILGPDDTEDHMARKTADSIREGDGKILLKRSEKQESIYVDAKFPLAQLDDDTSASMVKSAPLSPIQSNRLPQVESVPRSKGLKLEEIVVDDFHVGILNTSAGDESGLVNVISAAAEALHHDKGDHRIICDESLRSDNASLDPLAKSGHSIFSHTGLKHRRNVLASQNSLIRDKANSPRQKNRPRRSKNADEEEREIYEDADDSDDSNPRIRRKREMNSNKSRTKQLVRKKSKQKKDANKNKFSHSSSMSLEDSFDYSDSEAKEGGLGDLKSALLGAFYDLVIPVEEESLYSENSDSSFSRSTRGQGRRGRQRRRDIDIHEEETEPKIENPVSSLNLLRDWWRKEITTVVMQDPAISMKAEEIEEEGKFQFPRIEELLNKEVQQVLSGDVGSLWREGTPRKNHDDESGKVDGTVLLSGANKNEHNEDIDGKTETTAKETASDEKSFELWLSNVARALREGEPCGQFANLNKRMPALDRDFANKSEMKRSNIAKELQSILPQIRRGVRDIGIIYQNKSGLSSKSSFSDTTVEEVDRSREAKDLAVEMTLKDDDDLDSLNDGDQVAEGKTSRLTTVFECASEEVVNEVEAWTEESNSDSESDSNSESTNQESTGSDDVSILPSNSLLAEGTRNQIDSLEVFLSEQARLDLSVDETQATVDKLEVEKRMDSMDTDISKISSSFPAPKSSESTSVNIELAQSSRPVLDNPNITDEHNENRVQSKREIPESYEVGCTKNGAEISDAVSNPVYDAPTVIRCDSSHHVSQESNPAWTRPGKMCDNETADIQVTPIAYVPPVESLSTHPSSDFIDHLDPANVISTPNYDPDISYSSNLTVSPLYSSPHIDFGDAGVYAATDLLNVVESHSPEDNYRRCRDSSETYNGEIRSLSALPSSSYPHHTKDIIDKRDDPQVISPTFKSVSNASCIDDVDLVTSSGESCIQEKDIRQDKNERLLSKKERYPERGESSSSHHIATIAEKSLLSVDAEPEPQLQMSLVSSDPSEESGKDSSFCNVCEPPPQPGNAADALLSTTPAESSLTQVEFQNEYPTINPVFNVSENIPDGYEEERDTSDKIYVAEVSNDKVIFDNEGSKVPDDDEFNPMKISDTWVDVGPSVFNEWRRKRNTVTALKKLSKLRFLRKRSTSSDVEKNYEDNETKGVMADDMKVRYELEPLFTHAPRRTMSDDVESRDSIPDKRRDSASSSRKSGKTVSVSSDNGGRSKYEVEIFSTEETPTSLEVRNRAVRHRRLPRRSDVTRQLNSFSSEIDAVEAARSPKKDQQKNKYIEQQTVEKNDPVVKRGTTGSSTATFVAGFASDAFTSFLSTATGDDWEEFTSTIVFSSNHGAGASAAFTGRRTPPATTEAKLTEFDQFLHLPELL